MVAILLMLLALLGLGHGQRDVAAPSCRPGTVERVGDQARSLAVEAGAAGVDALTAPSSSAPRIRHLGGRTPEGVTSVFLVRARVLDRECRAAWYRVLLPVRPNGASGWIRAAAVRPYVVDTRIVVDRAARRLVLERNGRVVRRIVAGVGEAGTPTPLGSFYVVERLFTPRAGGPYGPGALGLSAFSPTLTGWTRGGPIAIHGTDEASSVGQAWSHGCVRLANSRIAQLLQEVPAGTPVTIRG
jgi:lipoprotein-anchoring transpeptidase ErfK/SrfK